VLVTRARFLSLYFIVFVLTGCASAASSNPGDYVGEYVLRPNNSSPPSGFGDFLILKPDHVAVEIRFDKGSSQVETTQEKWYLWHGAGENLALGKFSASVEGPPSDIRLVINEYGQYYEKVR
jgi:hypothetical protein